MINTHLWEYYFVVECSFNSKIEKNGQISHWQFSYWQTRIFCVNVKYFCVL